MADDGAAALVEDSPESGSDVRDQGHRPMKSLKKYLQKTVLPEGVSTDLQLLVVGTIGQGKSTLVNSIIELEENIAKEGVRTSAVQKYPYSDIIPDTKITIIDTPGLQDTPGNEQTCIQLKSECQEVSRVLYCMKMKNRLKNEDKFAMEKLHQAFGPKFWKKVVFVLTFANDEKCDQRDVRDDQEEREPPLADRAAWKELMRKRFDGRVQHHASEIKKFLKEKMNIDLNVVLIKPAGHYNVTHTCRTPFQLPSGKSWLDELLSLCCFQMRIVHNFTKLSHPALITFKDVLESERCVSTGLRLLVTGRTGEGKSTLVNGIIELGKEVSKEGAGNDSCTDSVQQFEFSNLVSGVSVTVMDSPGLQDTEQKEQTCIQLMKNKCREVSMVLYCMKMSDRLTSDDMMAMQKLHQAFGPKFWERVAFVLTYANKEDCEQRDDRDDLIEEPPEDDEAAWDKLIRGRFIGRLQHRVTGIKTFLREKIHIDSSVVDSILIVPAGNYRITRSCREPLRLPDRRNWLYELLKSCCIQIKTVHKFTKLSLHEKIHFAIILDSHGEVMINGGSHTINDQAATIKDALERLGFCVLYFNRLSSKSITCLLEAFQCVDHSELATFALVILSKGATCHLYDGNSDVFTFEQVNEKFRSIGGLSKVPKIFFFHMAYDGEKPSDRLAFDVHLPQNSIAFAVSIKCSNYISPAVTSFVKVMNEQSCQPLKECFMEIKNAVTEATCVCKDTLDDNFVLPTPFQQLDDCSNFVKKKWHLCRTMWYHVRCKTVDVLMESKESVQNIIKRERMATIASSGVSAVGGAMAVAGLLFAIPTFGVSLSLTAAGTAVGVAGGSANVISFIVSQVMSSRRLTAAKQQIVFDQQFSRCLNVEAAKYTEARESYRAKFVVDGIVSAVRFGTMSLADDAVVAAGRIAGVTAARTAGRVIGTAVAAVAVPVDIGHMIYNIYLLNKSVQDKSGKSDSDKLMKWFVKQIEELLKGLFTTLDVRECGTCIVEGQVSNTFNNSECGYKVSVQSAVKQEKSTLAVRTILSGPFSLPEGATLVSAVYDVLMEEKLQAPVTIEIEHCVDITDWSTAKKMTFATATVDFDKKVFVFTPLEGGAFPQGQTHGSISLSNSSLLCILYYSESQQDQLMKYAAQCSTIAKFHKFWELKVTFTKCLNAHNKYVQMEAVGAVKSSPFTFTSDSIDLADFRRERKENGCIISPSDIPDNISKDMINTVESLSDLKKSHIELFPSFTLHIQVEAEERASDLSMEVKGTDLKLTII